MRFAPLALVCLIALPAPSRLAAQTADPLVTDRPDFTESAVTVRPGRVQLEAGYTFGRNGDASSHTFGEVLLRIGALSRIEIRVGLNSYAVTDSRSDAERGFEDVSLGAKISLLDPPPHFELFRPAVALLVGTSLPTGADGFGGEGLWPETKLALAWGLSERVSLGTNLNIASVQTNGDRFAQFSGSLALGVALSDRLGTFAELFGFASGNPQGLDTGFLNGGATFLAHDNVQLDARAGIGFDNREPNYFLGLGFAWRL